jgi:hypothetical protein
MENPIYIKPNEAAIIVQPWHNERIVDNLIHIGGDSGNDLDESNVNIMNAYIYPLGIKSQVNLKTDACISAFITRN